MELTFLLCLRQNVQLITIIVKAGTLGMVNHVGHLKGQEECMMLGFLSIQRCTREDKIVQTGRRPSLKKKFLFLC